MKEWFNQHQVWCTSSSNIYLALCKIFKNSSEDFWDLRHLVQLLTDYRWRTVEGKSWENQGYNITFLGTFHIRGKLFQSLWLIFYFNVWRISGPIFFKVEGRMFLTFEGIHIQVWRKSFLRLKEISTFVGILKFVGIFMFEGSTDGFIWPLLASEQVKPAWLHLYAITSMPYFEYFVNSKMMSHKSIWHSSWVQVNSGIKYFFCFSDCWRWYYFDNEMHFIYKGQVIGFLWLD